MLKEKG